MVYILITHANHEPSLRYRNIRDGPLYFGGDRWTIFWSMKFFSRLKVVHDLFGGQYLVQELFNIKNKTV